MRSTWLLSLCDLCESLTLHVIIKKLIDWVTQQCLYTTGLSHGNLCVISCLLLYLKKVFFALIYALLLFCCSCCCLFIQTFFLLRLSVFRPFSLRSRFSVFGELKMFLWLFCVCACVLVLNPTHFPASVCCYVTSLTCDMTLDDQLVRHGRSRRKGRSGDVIVSLWIM